MASLNTGVTLRQFRREALKSRAKLVVLEGLAAISPVFRQELAARRNRRRIWVEKLRRQFLTLQEFEATLATLTRDDVCIDCGANVGNVTRMLAETGATVHAFEPDPWSFGQLKARFGDTSNVVLHNKAVGVEAGRLYLRRSDKFDRDPANYSAATRITTEAEGASGVVDVIDFVAFLTGCAPRVSIVKIDIEGAELDLLERLFATPHLNRIGLLVVETHEQFGPEVQRRTERLRSLVPADTTARVSFDWV